jgi:Holliday junction DNA helicase RuvA
MITFLHGIVETKAPTRIELNVGGVGYEVFIPLSSYDRLPGPGGQVKIYIHDHIREDSHNLYGFMREDEREMFERLIGMSGVGPKIALSALSGLSIRDLKAALVQQDVKRLTTISGIGKKMAERMVVELKDKFSAGEALEAVSGDADVASDLRIQDAILALISLGYRQEDAWKMVRKILPKLDAQAGVEDIVRQALTAK